MTDDIRVTHSERYGDLLTALKRQKPTEELISRFVKAHLALYSNGVEFDEQKLIDQLKADLILYADFQKPDVFEDQNLKPEPWLEENRDTIKWLYWERYAEYLRRDNFNPHALDDLDATTDLILGGLQNPSLEGNWDSRGMVVGYIQSGKTANYTGLICKAADAGYKLIIVLAGVHNDLRDQTQQRIDSGFIGTKKAEEVKEPVGVGLISLEHKELRKEIPLEVNCLTSSTINGDFKKPNSQNRLNISPNGSPYCLVVKKNVSVLKNLNEWIDDLAVGSRIPGKVLDIPLLLIDDEADHASLNTRKYEKSENQGENDITSTNKYIRAILHKFQKSAYVGYTATPYANVFIDPDAKSEKYGADIFPRNFIISMPEPPGYFGSNIVFGKEAIADDDDFYPGIVPVDDDHILIPRDRRTDSTFVPKQMSPSLREAILSFILATAVRTVRNEHVNKVIHNSMLIHVSRYVAASGANSDSEELQTGISELVNTELRNMRADLVFPDSDRYAEFKELWETSFYPRSESIRRNTSDYLCYDVSWEQVRPILKNIVRSIEIRVLSGANKKDKLDYDNYKKTGLNVIAIGGDKLSRGLTLEGLTTSYFLRSAGTYDSLLQMGRWFGFRVGYVDVCRIYTTADMIRKFRLINVADEHLRKQFRDMNEQEKTPLNYGLKIIQNDPRFRITSQNKMRKNTKHVGNPYAGSLKQTYKFVVSPDVIKDNFQIIEQFISEIEREVPHTLLKNKDYIWRDVPADLLLDYMQKVFVHPELGMGTPLYQYIREQSSDEKSPELTHWNVVLVNNSAQNAVKGNIAGLDVGYTIRNPEKEIDPEVEGEYTYSKHTILNAPSDEAIDMDGEWKGVKGSEIRTQRPVTKGLLLIYPITWTKRSPKNATPLIGLAYSFPLSNTAASNEFIGNSTYSKYIGLEE